MSVTHFEDGRTLPEANLTAVVDQRRRTVLAVLQGQEAPVDRRELAAQVAAAEQDATPDDVSEETIDDVLLTLHHSHLPKLEEAGYLEYDVARNRVVPRSASADAEAVLAEF